MLLIIIFWQNISAVALDFDITKFVRGQITNIQFSAPDFTYRFNVKALSIGNEKYCDSYLSFSVTRIKKIVLNKVSKALIYEITSTNCLQRCNMKYDKLGALLIMWKKLALVPFSQNIEPFSKLSRDLQINANLIQICWKVLWIPDSALSTSYFTLLWPTNIMIFFC